MACGASENHDEGVYNTRDPEKNGEDDVDDEALAEAGFQPDGERREKDGEDHEEELVCWSCGGHGFGLFGC